MPHSGQCDVQLTMGKDRLRQIDTNSSQRLPLRLVDGHRQRASHRKLKKIEIERHSRIGRFHLDSRNKDTTARSGSTDNLHFQNHRRHMSDDVSAAVVVTILWIQIPQQHHGHSDSQFQLVRWQTWRVYGGSLWHSRFREQPSDWEKACQNRSLRHRPLSTSS